MIIRILAFYILLISSLFSGCASTISNTVPSGRMTTPETSGDVHSPKLGLGYISSHDIELAQKIDYDNPVIGNNSIKKRDVIRGELIFPANKNLDIGAEGHFGITPLFFTAKLQVLGEPRNSKKSGSFSLALSGKIGYDSASGDYEPFCLFPGVEKCNVKKVKYNATSVIYDLAPITGYRFNDFFLMYFSYYYTWIRSHYKFEQTRTGGTFAYEGGVISKQSGAALGFSFDVKHLILIFEGVYNVMMTPSEKLRDYGATVGFQFEGR